MSDWFYLHDIINIFIFSDDGDFNVKSCITRLYNIIIQ
jgi:hypothetical protein